MSESSQSDNEQPVLEGMSQALAGLNDRLWGAICGVWWKAFHYLERVWKCVYDFCTWIVNEVLPNIYRKIKDVIRFIFSRAMLNVLRGLLKFACLLALLVVSIIWPFLVSVYFDSFGWIVGGCFWIIFVGGMGAWYGLHHNVVGRCQNGLKRLKGGWVGMKKRTTESFLAWRVSRGHVPGEGQK